MIRRDATKNGKICQQTNACSKATINTLENVCKQTIKTPEWHHWQLSDADKEDTWNYLVDFAQVNVCRVGFSSCLQSRISALKWDCPWSSEPIII